MNEPLPKTFEPAEVESKIYARWEASGVFRGKPGADWTLVLTDLKAPADIGYDTKRGRVLVPLFMDSAVEAYAIP